MARQVSLIFGLIALSGLILRVILSSADQGSVGGAFAYLSQFFTILTNTFVAIFMLWLAASDRKPPAVLHVALTAAIVGVGLVYHAVLARLWDPAGLLFVADHLVHTIVPAITLLHFFLFADKAAVRWWMAPAAMIWPLVYCVLALVRASGSGFYPYPFLNLPELGATALATNIAGLAIGFLVLGAILVLAARLMAPKQSAVS